MVFSLFGSRAAGRSAVLAATLAVAGCGAPEQASVEDAWVRLPAVPRRPAAAYFTLHGGPADLTLVSVVCENAIRAEMHESMGGGGMMAMRPIRDVPVPARSEIVFRPGGRHVMLFDLNPAIKPGRPVKLLLTFADGERIAVSAATVAAGAPAPE